ncbi:MAG: M48 family metallopeptidase [Deltaproteobacteria bacterium]|nr:M48 family metallopeptidase [Deltaproteobacteria bacterium]
MISINSFLTAYVLLYAIVSASDFIIDGINSRHIRRHGNEVPEGFDSVIDRDQLERIESYTLDNIRLGFVRDLTGRIIFLTIILSGLLPWLAEMLKNLPFIIAGLCFFAVPAVIGAVFGLPFDYYSIFHIEEIYGFNTRTLKVWIMDLFKSLLIGVVLGIILLSLLLFMVKSTGNGWWIWSWLIFLCFQLVIAVIYPTVIAPVFNRFTPLDNQDLSERIRDLAEKEGLDIKGIFTMDAARRTLHTNAYFSGLGKTKRIVLYDTLLESHDDDEVLSVLAHEIGHLKKGHIKKQLLIMGVMTLLLFFVASEMIHWGYLYESFGFDSRPFYAGLFIIMIIWEPVGFFLSPIGMAISRRFEKEADHYVYKVMGDTSHIVRALKRMARDNLSNLRPHPLYVAFHYSHPPLLERIRYLEACQTKSDSLPGE